MNASSQARERLKLEKGRPAGPPHSHTEVGIPAAFGDLELLFFQSRGERGELSVWGGGGGGGGGMARGGGE